MNEAKSVAGKIRLLLHVQSTSSCYWHLMPKLLQTCPLRRATDGDNRNQWFPSTDLAEVRSCLFCINHGHCWIMSNLISNHVSAVGSSNSAILKSSHKIIFVDPNQPWWHSEFVLTCIYVRFVITVRDLSNCQIWDSWATCSFGNWGCSIDERFALDI